MSVQFLTNMTEGEFKVFLRDALREILNEQQGTPRQQQPEILDVRQAAQYLKLKIATLYEKTSRKLIPHFKKGNKLYFQLQELQQWVRQGKVKTATDIECEAATFTLTKK
jgi:excisionase family DNA binding protein